MKKESMKEDLAQDKRMIKKAVGMHEQQAHGGKKSNLSKLKTGGGVKVRGTGAATKGTMARGPMA